MALIYERIRAHSKHVVCSTLILVLPDQTLGPCRSTPMRTRIAPTPGRALCPSRPGLGSGASARTVARYRAVLKSSAPVPAAVLTPGLRSTALLGLEGRHAAQVPSVRPLAVRQQTAGASARCCLPADTAHDNLCNMRLGLSTLSRLNRTSRPDLAGGPQTRRHAAASCTKEPRRHRRRSLARFRRRAGAGHPRG